MNTVKIKPKLHFALLCDDVRQEVGGKFSLMGLFEGITANAFPVVHPRFAIVTEWSGGRGEFAVKIRLLTPNRDKVLSESDSKLVMFQESQRHRDISVRFNSVFTLPGTYWLEILVDNEPAAVVPLPVQNIAEQQNVH
jgi:hypothetical protein